MCAAGRARGWHRGWPGSRRSRRGPRPPRGSRRGRHRARRAPGSSPGRGANRWRPARSRPVPRRLPRVRPGAGTARDSRCRRDRVPGRPYPWGVVGGAPPHGPAGQPCVPAAPASPRGPRPRLTSGANRASNRPCRVRTMSQLSDPTLAVAAGRVLETGAGLVEPDVLAVLRLPDEDLPAVLDLAHQVRMRWCGPEVEVEGIVSVKTGGCPEDCHFCSQSGLFTSPVRAVWLDIPALVEAARQTAATGATEFCIVAAVRGPDERLMAQMREGVAAISAAVDIQIAASLGMLTRQQVDELVAMGVHRYNHNLETARSFFPRVVTTHTWEERFDTLRMVRDSGMEVCCGGILGLGESGEQRAEFAVQLASLAPDEVPLNFLNPPPGTPLGGAPGVQARGALRALAAFRPAAPETTPRAPGRPG